MTTTTDTAAALLVGSTTALGAVEDQLRAEAAKLLQASAQDIQTWVSRIASLMILAEASGSEPARESLHRQIRLLAEIQRVRVSDAAWSTFMTIAQTIASAAVKVTVGLLTSGAIKLQDGNA